MKFTILGYLAIIFPITVMASAKINGCQIGDSVIPFVSFRQEGAALVSRIRLAPHATAVYSNVWNQDSLSIIVDDKVIASDVAIMGPVQVSAELNGAQLSCYFSMAEAKAEESADAMRVDQKHRCQSTMQYCRSSGGSVSYHDCMIAYGCDPYNP